MAHLWRDAPGQQYGGSDERRESHSPGKRMGSSAGYERTAGPWSVGPVSPGTEAWFRHTSAQLDLVAATNKARRPDQDQPVRLPGCRLESQTLGAEGRAPGHIDSLPGCARPQVSNHVLDAGSVDEYELQGVGVLLLVEFVGESDVHGHEDIARLGVLELVAGRRVVPHVADCHGPPIVVIGAGLRRARSGAAERGRGRGGGGSRARRPRSRYPG